MRARTNSNGNAEHERKTLSLDDLPDELVLTIIKASQSIRVAGSLAATSWRYHHLATDESLWCAFYVDRFGPPVAFDYFLTEGRTWRWLYQARLPVCLTAPRSVGTALGSHYVYSGDWSGGRPHGLGLVAHLNHQTDNIAEECQRNPTVNASENRLTLPGPLLYIDGGWCQDPDDPLWWGYNDNMYRGEWQSGHRHGHGVMIYAYGSQYKGNWRHGHHDGFGIQVYDKGDRYEGEWKVGIWHGRGTFYSRDGWTVDGDWQDGRCHGETTVTSLDGTWTGTTEQGYFTGIVTWAYGAGGRAWGHWGGLCFGGETLFQTHTDGSSYRGGCDRGRADGFGVLRLTDGRHYEALWLGGRLWGYGIVTYPDQSHCECLWLDNRRESQRVVAHGQSFIDSDGPCPCLACRNAGTGPEKGMDLLDWIGGDNMDLLDRVGEFRP
ncbi:Morn repeat domain containing protein [Pandoravirus macleodensis]|uniref:Morn repeat domain containing protein n=1 Tax=Pandoravirus macleodensis TaxID=2107707 RepID=A0A2U7UFE9_9VIRU|nr:Morn repeat domain containing protein [Pandoravirus macleodensis]AVK77176.1 Morn repeat domain containing protein [Pandoravirus macleodensis]